MQGLWVVGKVKDQRAHQRITFLGDLPGTPLEIWLQLLALLQTCSNDCLSLGAVVPRLGIAHIAMHTHQGQIDANLYPTQHSFYISTIRILVGWPEETACIVGPPRDTCCLDSKASGNLIA